MNIVVTGAGLQRRKAIINTAEIIAQRLGFGQMLEVHFIVGDHPFKCAPEDDLYLIHLPSDAPIANTIMDVAVGVNMIRHFLLKLRRPITNSKTKYSWYDGRVIDLAVTPKYDDPSLIDATGRAVLMMRELKPLLVAFQRRDDQPPPSAS